MKHLVTTFSNVSLAEACRELRNAHDYLVDCTRAALSEIPTSGPLWGIRMKRLHVDLTRPGRPGMVRKDTERLGEVINMVATLERLVAAIVWFQAQPRYEDLRVSECHPSTSSAKGSNDLMLAAEDGQIVVRCEVCDVASRSAGQNGKESKDLKSLGCAEGVPDDGVRRFICTSPEFAGALQSTNRKSGKWPHRYRGISLGDAGDTVLLEIVPGPAVSQATQADVSGDNQ
jgi:hypothetical protein